MRTFLRFTLLLAATGIFVLSKAAAAAFSYLYIQGDKQTPFYVKVEDAMQPRFGKNYCIISQLAAGETHIEILFQQNTFPAQKFSINMPEGGSRGFLLVRKDAAFALYDLQNGGYLTSGDADTASFAASIKQPAAGTPPPVVATPQPAAPDTAKQPAPSPAAATVEDGGPKFINGIELGGNAGTAAPATTPAFVPEHADTASASARPAAIANTDCPAPMRSEEFSGVFRETNARAGDEDRLSYVSSHMDRCYTSWMARALTMRLQGDAARYMLLKKIYPRITDQGAFPLLDDLLTAEVWKAEFARLIHH